MWIARLHMCATNSAYTRCKAKVNAVRWSPQQVNKRNAHNGDQREHHQAAEDHWAKAVVEKADLLNIL